MATSLPLLRGSITLDDALKSDRHVLHELSLPQRRMDFLLPLLTYKTEVAELVALHLNVSASKVTVSGPKKWIHGSFNTCVPVDVDCNHGDSVPAKVLLRLAQPHKCGAEHFPLHSVDEKIRCEAATYAWMQDNSPQVPIPRLFGFGVPGGKSVTSMDKRPYRFQDRGCLPDLGYLIIEFFDQGQMLSESWKDHCLDPVRQKNLYRSLSRIMLAVARCSVPRIGSWTITNEGELLLTNRPLTWHLQQQENFGAETGMPRHQSFAASESYYHDLLLVQDHRLRGIPNSMHNESDGRSQLAMLAAMRTVLPLYCNRQSREGPFVMSLTDLHRSNIFVDNEWNIVKIIDLEWACARPIEMLASPSWLSGHTLEELAEDDNYREYNKIQSDFAAVFEEEEMRLHATNDRTLALRANWTSDAFWFFTILENPTLLWGVFRNRIMPKFLKLTGGTEDDFERIVSCFWDFDVTGFITSKLQEQASYDQKLRDTFSAAASSGHNAEATAESRDINRDVQDDTQPTSCESHRSGPVDGAQESQTTAVLESGAAASAGNGLDTEILDVGTLARTEPKSDICRP